MDKSIRQIQRCIAIVATLATLTVAARAQETRGSISGRVTDPSSSAVASAKVTLLNTETNASTVLSTNENGFFEANLLLPGTYRVAAEASGFKRSLREGIILSVGSRLQVDFTLELGTAAETVNVTAEAPLIDVSTAAAGRTVDSRSAQDLPIPGGNTLMLAKLAPGIQSGDSLSDKTVRLHSNGAGSRYTVAGNVGGNEWSIDGTPNNGNGRGVAFMPAPEFVQEFRIETAGFDASMGHSTGVNVSMMTKTGTNSLHGSLRETHHQYSWDALPFFTKQAYYRQINQALAEGDVRRAEELRSQPGQIPGRENQYAATLGGPVVIPKIYNGKDKLFFFFGFAGFRVGQYRQTYETVPTLANRQGDFSQPLNVDPVRYQIYDPLTVRPDPARPSHYIREPFPGNIIPPSRITNPAYKFYTDLIPKPNADPSDPKAEPVRNYVAASSPYQEKYSAYANRVDYRLSDTHRFFGRWSWNEWRNQSGGWLYQSSLANVFNGGSIRHNFGMSGDWVYTINSGTLLDVAVAGNQYYNNNFLGEQHSPSKAGLPAYLDTKAGDRAVLPPMAWSGYTGVSQNFPVIDRYRFYSLRADLSHLRSGHSFKTGVDFRGQYTTGANYGVTSGSFSFGNTWTRREEDGLTPAGT